MNLSQHALQVIDRLAARLLEEHSARPVWGCEFEWYYLPPPPYNSLPDAATLQVLHERLEAAAKDCALSITPITQEKGRGQYEMAFPPTADTAKLAADLSTFKLLLVNMAAFDNIPVSFAAKPYENDYGSALQVHIHLENPTSTRLFTKQEAEMSNSLRHSLGGLLATLPDSMPVFAPNPASYTRFVKGFDAPTTLSWGGNNRTVALRLPLKTGAACHIEHRVGGADADIAEIMAVMLAGILHGLENEIDPGEQIFGNAFDTHYKQPRILTSPVLSYKAMQNGHILSPLLGDAFIQHVLQQRILLCDSHSSPR